MALALSQRRLLVFGLETNAFGKPKGVKELVSSAPLSEVDSISVKRLLMGKTIAVALRGGEVKLEAGAGQDAKGPGGAVRAGQGDSLRAEIAISARASRA